MSNGESNNISRRKAILSIATLTAGVLVNPVAFVSAAPVQSSLRFAIIGDWGNGNNDQFATAQQMYTTFQANPFDFVLTVGDNIYPDGSGHLLQSYFEQPYAPLLRAGVKFYAALGNHDVIHGRQDQCQYPLFNMNQRCYYSLSQGNGLVEIFILDSTDLDRTQLGWLEGALRASKARWKLALFHHPLYSSGRYHGSDLSLRQQLEPLFIQYGVHMVFSGHDHIYERTHPQQGIIYFVTGAAGMTRQGDTDRESELTAAYFDTDNHFMFIEIDARQISYSAISETGKIVDQGKLIRFR
ncbi:MAG: metallophosphoesterase [Acidobacteriota bacterium]